MASSLSDSFVFVDEGSKGDDKNKGQRRLTRQNTNDAKTSKTPTPIPTPTPTPQGSTILKRAATVTPPVAHSSRTGTGTDTASSSLSSYAHDWSKAATNGGLSLHGRHFVDGYGRVCLPRGVNLSGSCKSPLNENPATFWSRRREVTFVGRPFPLKDAHEHFARLRRWGLTFVRFLITWEAIEHKGPGQYDQAYLKYLQQILSILPEYGMLAMVSMHQDVWSRFSGGSGAPAWTLEAVGFDLEKLEVTGAAWLDGVRDKELKERGIWPTGYQKLAAATMSTCFWGGDTFTPELKIEGEPAQQYLQSRFLKCWQVVAEALGGLEAVVGFDMLNEPHRGYIDLPSLHNWDYNTDLHLHNIPSAFHSFALGAGYPTTVPHWVRSFPMPTKIGNHHTLNQQGECVWRPNGPTGGKCLWEMHGVWTFDEKYKTAIVLRENYFKNNPKTGEKIDWYTDFYYPFLQKWAAIVRKACPLPKIVFVEPIPNEFCPESWTPERQIPNMVFSPHWYDLDALFRKEFGNFTVNVQSLSRGVFPLKTFFWGHPSARRNYGIQIRNLIEAGYKSLGERPVFIGETGVPMDMNKAEAFRTGNFTWQGRMMDALICALEQNLVGFTLWNYNPLNEDATGDQWNGENFSWFSNYRARKIGSGTNEQGDSSLDQGGRILDTIVRPYPAKVAGIPLKFEYEVNRGEFTFEWARPNSSSSSSSTTTKNQNQHQMDASASSSSSPSVKSPPLDGHPEITSRITEIFVPHQLVFGKKFVVAFDGAAQGSQWWYDAATQTLYVEQPDPATTAMTTATATGTVYKMIFGLTPPNSTKWPLRSHWEDFAMYYLSILAVVLAIIAYFAL